MKPSEAILKGFAMAGGKQCVGNLCIGNPKNPDAVCVEGAYLLGTFLNARAFFPGEGWYMAAEKFLVVTGHSIIAVNNGRCAGQTEPMSIPDIAGILAAEGL